MKTPTLISTLLVDDHPLVRAAIHRLLSEIPTVKVLAEASSGEEALRLVRQQHPDLVLMDLMMPGMGGLEAIPKILRYCPKTKIIALSSYTHDLFVSHALQAGAKGYLSKGTSLHQIQEAIHTVMNDQIFLAPEIAQTLAFKKLAAKLSPLESLSKRELEIALKISQGLEPETIAKKLCISPKTVHTYRHNIHHKLKIENDVHLIWLLERQGLLALD